MLKTWLTMSEFFRIHERSKHVMHFDFYVRLEGLEAGEEAYLTKPFKPGELKLRVEALNMSRNTLRGPNELIRHIRLEKAKQLLGTGLSISEIAFSVGFSSLAYFSKCFKDKYGHSPSDALSASS